MPATSTKSKNTSAKRKPPAKKPAAKKKTAPPTRARRTQLASRPSLRGVLELEPHQIDILALAIIAAGIFLGGVTYLHWAGGSLGHSTVTGVRILLGVFAYLVPVALIAGGAMILAREIRTGPPARPVRTGTVCLAIGLTLAMAAGTLGIGPGREPAVGFWSSHVLETRGGVIGAGEFWVLGHLLSTAGADIVAIFLFIAAAILLSGATLASFVLATRDHAHEAIRTSQEIRISRMPQRYEEEDAWEPDELYDDEPPTGQMVLATHVEAPPVVEAPVVPIFEEFEDEVGAG